ncbi:unnamed protein product [Sphagnum jensenii]
MRQLQVWPTGLPQLQQEHQSIENVEQVRYRQRLHLNPSPLANLCESFPILRWTFRCPLALPNFLVAEICRARGSLWGLQLYGNFAPCQA